MPDLSIVMITHNQQKLLLDCLQSLYAGSPDLTLEVIVVFNRCSDGSLSEVSRLFPQVIGINNPQNEGFSRANNHGLKKVSGDYVMLLNDDTRVAPGALKTLLEFLKAHPRAGAAGPRLLNPDGTLQIAGSKLAARRYQGNTPRQVKFLGFAACVFPREVVRRVGFLDENYFFYNEELDYLTRVRRAGFECWYVPRAEIVHLGGQSTKARRYDFELEGLKGTFYYIGKFYPVLYPFYRLIFALLAVMLQLAAPGLLLFAASKDEIIGRSKFYRDVARLALTWRKGKYVPRQYFD